jgi:hypothetical protein
MRAKERQEISHKAYQRQALENHKNILRSHKKRVMEIWASNPRALNGWGLCNKKFFMSYWCQWFPKPKVIARWNKCKNLV